MTFGVTPEGFVIKRLEDIRNEINDAIRSVFGNNVNLDDRGPFGQFIGIFAEREALVWELAEEVYQSQYPDSAEGTNLDNVASITGTIRNPATKSEALITFLGTVGTVIPVGTIVSKSDDPDVKFETAVEGTVAAGVNEVQRITFASVPSAGSFTLNFNGETTDPILFSDGATEVKDALEALVNIDQVAVVGSYAAGFDITFEGNNAATDVSLLQVIANTLEATESGTITTVADSSGSLDRTFFIIEDDAGTVGVWFDIDDSGSSIPLGAANADRAIEISTVNTDDTADAVAAAVQAALNADAAFSASVGTNVGTNVVTYTMATSGNRTDAADGDTGFSFAVTNQGADVTTLVITPTETTKGVVPRVDVQAFAQTAGALAAPAESLTVIETPVSGIDSASNETDAIIGLDTESDADLKVRRNLELARAGRATTDAIRANVLEVEAVTAVIVFENDLAIPDIDGRPPKSVQIVAQGGDDQDVADAIFDSVAAGIELVGDTVVNVTDSQGFTQPIRFDRPTERDVYVEWDITTDPNEFPTDGVQQVSDAILAYGLGQDIGEDVIVRGTSALICAADSIPGIVNIVIRLGFTASPTTDDNLSVQPNEIATFDSSRITVAVV